MAAPILCSTAHSSMPICMFAHIILHDVPIQQRCGMGRGDGNVKENRKLKEIAFVTFTTKTHISINVNVQISKYGRIFGIPSF